MSKNRNSTVQLDLFSPPEGGAKSLLPVRHEITECNIEAEVVNFTAFAKIRDQRKIYTQARQALAAYGLID